MSEGLCNISRCIILLTDEDRFTRKKALKSIESYLNTNDDKEISIYGTLAENLANALNDPVEVNRELAIKVLMLTINVTKDIRPLLPIIVPVIVMRLGQKEIIEQSEEIRYSTLNFIYILVTRTDETSPFLDDYISIIQKTLVDPYHEVKKLSCRIAIALSEKKCHRFYQVSESILMPMLSNLTHQHSKVRLETVVALEKVLMHSQGKLVDSVIPPLTQRLFDSSSAVRRAVIELVGSWLLDLPDRYSYQTRLLPLLLSGFIDESDEIHVITMNLWHHIGLKFEKENEENLKDKLDFDHNLPSYYPYGCKRPILGCRELVYRSASKLFPGLCKDLSDWQEATRLKSASLLPILILHLEESATQHTQHLLTGIANGLTDALSRMSPVGNISLINMMTFVSFRQVSPSNITVNELDIVGFIATHSTPQAFSSSDVNEAVKVINQLFISAQILGCMISTKNELISVMSVGAKAGLLKCVQVSIEHLNEAIDLLKQDSKQQHEHALESLQLSDDSQRDIAETTYNSAKLLVQDEQIRSWLFEIILGLGGVWPENDLVSSDFGQTILSSCDRLMERLAVCHRDCINLSKQYHLSSKGSDVNEALVINSASTNDFDQLLFSCMPKSISWHPRSIGLSLLSCCLQLATGPALLFTFNNHGNNQECLAAILDLLERGCRLNSAPGGGGSGVDNAGSQFDKSPGGTDPLTLASEAELRLRGLMLLTKLTDNNHIRTVLSSSKYLSYCFSKLILPVCVWRAGRTSEAMRKAACTSYLALLASAVSIRHLSEIILNSRTSSEIHIDQWLLTNNIESMHSVMQELTNNEFNNDENNAVRSTPKFSNLPCLPSSLLSLMLARLGSLLDDDLEGTRRLACLCLTIFFNGLLIPPPLPSSSTSSLVKLSSADQNHDENKVVDFLNSPTWIQSLTTNTTISSNSSASHEMPKECNILLPNVPLANSFGDQVFRFYGNFIKRLNDSKDQIRILICETIIAWIRLLIPMLTSSPSSATTIKASPQLNPVYSGVMEDFLNHLIIHLDDPSSQIRASVSRILLRINQFSSDLVIKALNKSRSCHRSFQLCDKLLEYCQSSHSHQYN
ncbi:Dynein assembly factor 5, axonemal [Schistosoma japonicum]|nr:Dynein assembly factor 5, axonemal [Schistosoma japonicum]